MLTDAILGLSVVAAIGLFAALLLGGVVKGALGIGLPLVLVPLTTQFLAIPAAVALLTVPMVASNIGQALEGGHTVAATRRLLPLLGPLVAGTLLGTHLLLNIDRRVLSGIIGGSFMVIAGLLLCMPRVRIPAEAHRWASPLVGFTAGVLGGISAMFGPPVVAYLVGLGTAPDTFVKSMAIVAFTASVTLLLALGGSGMLSSHDLVVSAGALIPIQLAMPLGRWLRGYIAPGLFRAAVLGVLVIGGLDLLRRGFW